MTLTSQEEDNRKDHPKYRPFSWKFKWFSEESLYKFVSVLDALRSEEASTVPVHKKILT